MESFVLIIVILGSHGHAIESVQFASLELCEAAKSQYMAKIDPMSAPGYFSNGGKETAAFCAKTMGIEQ